MKAMRLLVCGVLVCMTAAAAPGQSPPARPRWQAPDPARPLWAPAGQRAPAAPKPPLPRGNLRGDIENNARTHGAASRQPGGPARR